MVASLGTDAFVGSFLSVAEAASLGLPFEVVKTYMGGNRGNTTVQSIQKIYQAKGIRGFWSGLPSKSLEALLKGPILLIAKDKTQDYLMACGYSTVTAGYAGGFVGGVSQTIVMAPLTFLVTRAVSSANPQQFSARDLYREHGIRGMYAGSVPIALRQASNWSLRQGFTDFFRGVISDARGGSQGTSPPKLSKADDILAGILGGTLACINQPFEVARIEQQWRQAQSKGGQRLSTYATLALIYRERGIRGWYVALTPRIALSIWQTLFMVTFARFVKEKMQPVKTH